MTQYDPKQTIFMSGIHTGIGKTIASAVVARALNAEYWKPVQTGTDSDTQTVRDLAGVRCYPEAYRFPLPVSPHLAAEKAGSAIKLAHIQSAAPDLSLRGPHTLVVEGAGGVLSPLSREDFVIDIARALGVPTILVTTQYLGSLNHTYLSLEAIRSRGIPLLGVILVGEADPDLDTHLKHTMGSPILAHISKAQALTPEFIEAEAQTLRTEILHTKAHPLWTYYNATELMSGIPSHLSKEPQTIYP